VLQWERSVTKVATEEQIEAHSLSLEGEGQGEVLSEQYPTSVLPYIGERRKLQEDWGNLQQLMKMV
jgi:hypothetical protein